MERQCCRGALRFGKNQDLDGFLEPVNLFDLVFNVCAAGACFCFFMLTSQGAAECASLYVYA